MDKRAQIRRQLQIVTVPNSITRTHHLEAVSDPDCSLPEGPGPWAPEPNPSTLFEVACMKQLGSDPPTKQKSINEQLEMHDAEYVNLIKKYPKLLEPSFNKGEPTHGVYHKIETQGPPCKTKRRPIVMDSAKAAAGKAAWEKMEKDGSMVLNQWWIFLLIDERLSQGVYLLVADFLKVFARQQPLLHNIAVAP